MSMWSPIIGKFKGIPIQLHWTFVLLMIFALVISVPLFFVLVILFACVLLHEMSHTLTAYRNNVPVEKIILYPLGGGSLIDSDVLDPELEFRISLAGPIASFIMGFAFGIVAVIMPGGEIESFIQIFFLLNILLAVFNIIPWFPLDGGRVLRGYFRKKYSFINATKKTVMVSNAITILFIIGTLVYAAVSNYTIVYKEFIIFIDIFMAMFIYSGAKSEMELAYIRENTKNLSISSLVSKNYILFRKPASLKEIYDAVIKYHTNIILFKSKAGYQVISKLPAPNINALNLNISNKQSSSYYKLSLPVVDYNKKVYDVFNKMQNTNLPIIGVTKGKTLVGVISRQHLDSFISLHMSNISSVQSK
ncbi:S2P/M50B family intramembrane-cleaving metalloendopeptidase SpoIVFB [Candidatus Mancarchaeum acidiphilum]|uniref:Zinc metalloprotease n=1 Tax=Candidatus Mancarchaeum acidiphilum TaxID=1920749 RepID=A0A218NNS5_9ARCH|nr:site-2 protease family protein [Candidatus Mancarchaeum acidiphilum]ASI14128.1 S2P/M50B family intramembrane-cleaving metalloendopeptidase SpoIVFB [Candidatus Mancarchaeum acidiphilum]